VREREMTKLARSDILVSKFAFSNAATCAATARAVTGSETATVEEGVEWMHALVKDCGVPGLGQFGLKEQDFAEVGVGRCAVLFNSQYFSQ
jgi:hypothetical protein